MEQVGSGIFTNALRRKLPQRYAPCFEDHFYVELIGQPPSLLNS